MKRILTTFAILGLSFGSLIGGSGKGPGKKTRDVLAQFVLPNPAASSATVELLGDGLKGVSVYKNDDLQPGVAAYFMGSGNPKLELTESSDRFLTLRPNGECSWLDDLADPAGDVVVKGDAMWFARLSSVIESNGGLIGDLCSGYDSSGNPLECFLTMDESSPGFSMMSARYTATVNGMDYLYRVLLGKQVIAEQDDPREPVVVTRTGLDSWHISGFVEGVSVGTVSRKPLKKGRSDWVVLGECSFNIDYDICTADAANCGVQ